VPDASPDPGDDRPELASVFGGPLSREIAALHARPLRQTSRRGRIVGVTLAVVLVLGGLVAGVSLANRHYDATVRNPAFCPTVPAVNDLLGTGLASVSVVHEGDLLSCSYGLGSSSRQALSLDIDQPNSGIGVGNAVFGTDNPCHGKPPVAVAGFPGCDMTGSVRSSGGRRSVLVKDGQFDFQFTSYVATVSMTELVTLARAILTGLPKEV
jgi:hypothetical protein